METKTLVSYIILTASVIGIIIELSIIIHWFRQGKPKMTRYHGSEDYDYGDEDDIDFAEPGGRSALRAASKSNPRNLPCPNCGMENALTPADRALGYQCNYCADRADGTNYGRSDY